MEALGRTNDAVLYGGQVHLTVTGDDDPVRARRAAAGLRVQRLRRAVRQGVQGRGLDFYKIDPLLFSPAQIRVTSAGSGGRSFEAGQVNLEVLERSFWG